MKTHFEVTDSETAGYPSSIRHNDVIGLAVLFYTNGIIAVSTGSQSRGLQCLSVSHVTPVSARPISPLTEQIFMRSLHGQQIDCDDGKISTVERGLLDELHSSRQHPGQTAGQCELPLAAIPHPLSQTRAHPRNALLRSSSFRFHPLISSELQANPASSLSGGHLLKVLFLVRKGILS